MLDFGLDILNVAVFVLVVYVCKLYVFHDTLYISLYSYSTVLCILTQ